MKIVGITLPYSHLPFERAVEGLARSGYRYIGFGLRHQGEFVPSLEPTPAEIDQVGEVFRRYGVEPFTMFARAKVTDPNNLEQIEALTRDLDMAVRLGIRYITSSGIGGYKSFPDVPYTEEEMREPHSRYVEAMKIVGELVRERDLTIVLKPHTGNTATAGVLLQTLQEIGSPAVQAFYDPGNVRYYEGVDPAQDVKLIIGDMPLLCAKDHQGARAEGNFPVPGEGDVDFHAIFKHLHGIGFDGVVTVERVDGSDKASSLDAQEIDARMERARNNLIRIAREAGYSEDPE